MNIHGKLREGFKDIMSKFLVKLHGIHLVVLVSTSCKDLEGLVLIGINLVKVLNNFL